MTDENEREYKIDPDNDGRDRHLTNAELMTRYPDVLCYRCGWKGPHAECGFEQFEGLAVLECPSCKVNLAHVGDGGHHGPAFGSQETYDEGW